MKNVFLNFLYKKEFSADFIDRFLINFEYKRFLRKLKKETPSFDLLWDFAEFLRWTDIIYGFEEDINNDIDLSKKRNPYCIDRDTKKEISISFTIRSSERTKIFFNLTKQTRMIEIDVMRDKIPTSEDKVSSIHFKADTSFEFTPEDSLMIQEINRILQNKMIKYLKMFMERI